MKILSDKTKENVMRNNNFNIKIDDFSIKGSSLLGKENETQQLFEKDNSTYPFFSILKIKISRATLKEASIFKELLDRTISDDGNNIIIDMKACEFVDSSFFGVLVGGLKRVNRTEMKFHIVHNSTNKLPVFSATGLDKIFKVFDSIDDAVQI